MGVAAVGSGGSVTAASGDSTAVKGTGGDLNLSAGQGANGGDVSIKAGSASTHTGGNVVIAAGEGTTVGGSLTLSSGVSINPGSSSGAVTISTGGAQDITTGGIVLQTGDSVGSSTSTSAGAISLQAGSSGGPGADVTMTAGSSDTKSGMKGGSVALTGGAGVSGGDVLLAPGAGDGGRITLQSSDGSTSLNLEKDAVHIRTEGSTSNILLTVPEANPASTNPLITNTMIGLGFTTPGTGIPAKVNFRLQSTMNAENTSSLIIATAPMHVTTMKFSSDERIKEDIDTIDADDILQVFPSSFCMPLNGIGNHFLPFL